MRKLALTQAELPTVKLDCFVDLAHVMHRSLEKAYKSGTKEDHAAQSQHQKFESVPDVQAYSDIWVGLGLLAKIKPDHHEL